MNNKKIATEGLTSAEAGEKPAGIYIHIPFCLTKCPYCDFNSYPVGHANIHEYMDALAKQVKLFSGHPWVKSRKFDSLYIGGGTPTIIESSRLAGLIESCLSGFPFAGLSGVDPEVSVECNPNTVSLEKLIALKKAGVNRLSIGVQSFSDKLLGVLGRSHSAAEARNAFALAREAGFANISIDLMYGLPQQELTDWLESLDTALGLGPEHFSLYELTIEAETPFHKLIEEKRLQKPDEEEILLMESAAQQRLAGRSYQRYEISNYAKPGHECRHNINYWENGSYLGLGAGAVSCFSGLRIKNTLDPIEFIRMADRNRQPFADEEQLLPEARFRETVIMGLRMTAGVSVNRLKERFGIDIKEYYGERLQGLIDQGLLEFYNEDSMMRLTEKGLPIANQVLSELV